MQNVLLGGLITLAVTALVQILIIPWVQRRTRALERWERDVIALVTAVNEEFSGAIRTFRSALEEHWVVDAAARGEIPANIKYYGSTDEPGRGAARVRAVEAWSEMNDLYIKILMLLRRCALVRRRSPYWASLFDQINLLMEEVERMNTLDFAPGERLDFDGIRQAHARVRLVHGQVSARLQRISHPVRPPRSRRMLAIRRRLNLPVGRSTQGSVEH